MLFGVLRLMDTCVVSACADLQSLSLPGVSSGATQFVQDSNEALAFNLVREPLKEDLEEGQFNPEMTHQIYGEK